MSKREKVAPEIYITLIKTIFESSPSYIRTKDIEISNT